jgi:DNA-binding MarR family transcriptional regulator
MPRNSRPAGAIAASPTPSTSAADKPPPATLPEPQQLLLRRFRIVFNAVKTHFRQVEKTAGIGGAQLWALGIIQERPGLGVNDLAAAMDVHQSTASNLVRALVERDYVRATRGGTDRRAVALHVQPAGAAVIDKAPGPLTGVLPAALSRLDPAAVTRLNADLAHLIAVLEADEHAGNTPLSDL